MGRAGRHIPNRFKKFRRLLLYNQKSASVIMQVSQEDLSRWENGEKLPSVENLLKLMVLTEMPAEELLWELHQRIKTRIDERKRLYRDGEIHEKEKK